MRENERPKRILLAKQGESTYYRWSQKRGVWFVVPLDEAREMLRTGRAVVRKEAGQ